MKSVSKPESKVRVLPSEWNALTHKIIGAAIEVHSILGPGLLEKLYEEAMVAELHRRALNFQRQVPITMNYKGTLIGDLKLDLVVERLVVVELKAIAGILDVHRSQLQSYFQSTDYPLGLLMNFNTHRLMDGVCRRINPHCPLVQVLPLADPPIAPSLSSPLVSASSAFSEFHSEDFE